MSLVKRMTGGVQPTFKDSRGSADKTLVEFKLTKNSQLERNLEKQTTIHETARDAKITIKAIVYFDAPQKRRLGRLLKRQGLTTDKNVILIDARRDNKPSGSKA
jgi:dephospho-CoA kinase